MARIKVVSYTVHASKEQALRWARVARYLRCRSVSAWLEELADEQARRVEGMQNWTGTCGKYPEPALKSRAKGLKR